MTAPTLTVEPVAAVDIAGPTPAEEAARHAAVLATLLAENPSLPVLIWSVYPSGLVGRAVGRNDQDVVAKVQAWARRFRAVTEVLSTAQVVSRHRPGYADAWVVEPGEVVAQIPAIGGTVVGELVEVTPGGRR